MDLIPALNMVLVLFMDLVRDLDLVLELLAAWLVLQELLTAWLG